MHTPEQAEKLSLWLSLAESSGWWHPHKGVVFMCERPSALSLDERGRLHMDGGPALQCRDGWAVYALHGIRVKPCQALTPAEQIKPEEVLSETNADVRRELIRKVGVDRMLAKLPHKVMETRGNYQLLTVNLSEQVRDARYLKMINPSVGVFHVEGVAPECDTVEKSLNWRNGNWHETAEILT